MSPERIQRRRTAGWRMGAGDRAAIYVGRPTRWGNPYRVGERYTSTSSGVEVDLTPGLVVAGYRTWVSDRIAVDPLFLEPLRGNDLACWCPEACGEEVGLYGVAYGVAYGDLFDPCTKPKGHDGYHDPSAPPFCHADVLLELANA